MQLLDHGSVGPPPAHTVQLYDDEKHLVRSVAEFLIAGLAAGEFCVVIATERHLAEFAEELASRGADVAGARAAGLYLELDAARTLAQILRDGMPDSERFAAVVGERLRGAANGQRRVRAFGEMVALLSAEGNFDAALRLEALWSELARALPLSIQCAYPSGDFVSHGSAVPLANICAEHDLVRVEPAPESQDRLAAIVGSCEDAIVSKTLQGVVTSWNASAERIFGYRAEEMIGRSILRIIPPERRSEFETILETIRRGERVEHFETERVRKDGRRIHVSVTVSPIRDSAGRVVGASKIARDVTERRRLEAEREQLLVITQRARAEAEAAISVKDEFLAMLSHELRNPLSAVRNAVVSARLDPRDRDRALEIAYRQAEQLSRLVDDLLDLSRISNGRIRLRWQRVALKDVIERAVDTVRFLVEDRGHTLRVTPPPEPVQLNGDPARLEQVIVNLLSNAAKYTEPGGHIELLGEFRRDEAVIRVRDDGAGIAEDLLPHIFDLFVQGQRSPARTAGGLGIGLTVVRELVALHSGRVEAHSAGPGRGAEFVVRLPASREARGETPEPEPSIGFSRNARSGVSVMVVEDNPDAAESLVMLLEALGHDARAVSDGFEALKTADAEVPDVMLVDVGLPGMDGYEVARRVRETEPLREVLLVALTGYAREEDRRRALAAGFDHHLAKPVDPQALRRLLGRVASGDSRRAAGGGAPSQPR